MRSCALVLGLLLLATPPAPAEQPPARADAVLAALQAAVHRTASPGLNSRDLLITAIRAEQVPAAGRKLHLPVLPPHCGLTIYGGLDALEAQALLRRLFAAYGLVAKPGFRVGVPGGELVLDGFDAKAKVGFLLLPPAVGDARAPVSEPDASLLPRIAADGRRVLVTPLALFRSAQGDSLSPLLALALSAIDFLNQVTSGEDVAASSLASEPPALLPLPDLDAGDVPTATSFQFENGNAFFAAEAGGTLDLPFRAPFAPGHHAKGVGLLILPWYALTMQGAVLPAEGGPHFVLRQGTLTLESKRPVFVLPPSFDGTKPFRIRVAYVPGQTYLGGPVTLRLP